MSPNLPTLEELVHAICEGTPIDWDAIEQVGSDSFRSRVAALRVVAGIAAVHRPEVTTTVPPAAPSDTPRRWGHLDVLEHIASGAFGDVYRAWDPQLDREVALKLLRRASDAEAHADEAVDEGRLLARLRHPHIVSVYGAARIEGQVGLWMEYLRGRTLAQAVSTDGALPTHKVAEIGAALCDALAAVHKAGLVHRDVKAQNVMLADDGRVVLMDFGAGGDLRHVGLDVAGTPLYLAPEVARGGPASPQSDIYSLGVLLRYAATGAYSRDVAASTIDRPLMRLIAVAAIASAHEPRDRFGSADACGRQLRTLLVHSRVSRTAVGVGTGLVVGLGVLLVLLMRAGSVQDNEDRAFKLSWQTASPRRAPLSAEQMQSLAFDVLAPMSQSGMLSALSDEGRSNLLTVSMGRDDVRVWTSFDQQAGHAATAVASEDGKQLAYVWIDATCRCASLKVVDQDNKVRAVSLGREIRGAWLGGWRSHFLPILIAPEQGPHLLAIVDVAQGAVRVVRKINRDPSGFSLSPDRRFLAFDTPQRDGLGAARQVVVSGLDTGREEVVANSGSDWAQPEWSPDGTRLYFLERAARRTSLLAVLMNDGRAASQPVRLREDFGPLDTYGFVDRDTLGYWSGFPRHSFTVHAQPDGTFRANTATRSDVDGTMPAWSPDGRSLAWSVGTWPAGIQIRSGDEPSGRRLPALLDSAIFPTWSPDGRRIAFWSTDKLTRSIQIVDLTSNRAVEAFRRGFPFLGGEFALSWTSDGAELLISTDSSQILALTPETRAVRTWYRPHGASIESLLYQSPDSHSLGFVETREGRQQLRIMPLDSKGLSRLRAMPPALLIGWHADGRSVLAVGYVSSGQNIENELWRVPIDGGPPQSLGLKAPGLLYAAMSPDGKRMAYSSGTGLDELWLLSPAAAR